MMTARNVDPAAMMTDDDYSQPAEIFLLRRSGAKRSGLTYRRFATAAEAIDYAVTECASLRPDDLVMAVEDKRFNLGTLRALHREARHSSPSTVGEATA